MSPRQRRYTLPTAAVLAVLGLEENRVWSVTEVAEQSGLAYGSVYSILQRLWGRGLVARQYVASGFGQPKLYYDLSDPGWDAVATLLEFMPNPVEALKALVMEVDDA